MSDKTWITGEFVETVQLQVVCRTLISKLAPNATEISMEHLEAYGSLDKALQVFYEDSIREVVEKTREVLQRKGKSEIKEGVLRNWFEKKLITQAHTRGLIYRGATHTEGLINEAVNLLDQAHIIREERRGSGRWYELSHDRFVDPILTSNKEWMLQYSGAAKVRQWLEERATRWNQTQDETALLSENELKEAESWVASAEASELGYDRSVTNLIQASRTHINNKKVQREFEIESANKLARSARRFKWASIGLAVMFVLALTTTLIASVQWRKAYDNLELAEEREQEAQRLQKQASQQAERELWARVAAIQAAKEADAARQEAANRADEAEKAKKEAVEAQRAAEKARGELRDALKKAEERAREAERARKTDQLSREAFRLSRRPESQQDAVEQFNRAIDVYKETGDRDAQADSYLNQGQVYKDMGEVERAEDAFNKALQLYRHTPADPQKQASTLNNIGIIYTSSGASDPLTGERNEEALATAKTKFYSALTMYRALQDLFGEAATLTNIGDAQLAMKSKDDRRRASDFYERALGIYTYSVMNNSANQEKHLRALLGMFISLGNKQALLAEANEDTFSLDDRIEMYKEALDLYTQLNDKRGMAIANTKIGAATEEALQSAATENVERYEKLVLDSYKKAADLYKESHDAIGEAGAHISLGHYYQTLADPEKRSKAVGEYSLAATIYRSIDDRAGQIRAHKALYDFYATSSEAEHKAKAVASLVLMNDLYRELENVRGQSDTYLKLGALHENLQFRDKAETAFDEALKLYRTSGDKKTEADVLGEIGRIYAKSKDKAGVELAVQRLNQAADIYRETKSTEALAATYNKLAELHSQSPWRLAFPADEATQWYLNAVKYYEMEADTYRGKGSKSDPVKVAKVLRFIGSVYRDRLDDKAKALESLNQALKLYEEARNPAGIRAVKIEIANLAKQSGAETSKP